MLSCATSDSPTNPTLESVVADYLQAEESGQPQSHEEWLARYPELADDLTAFFKSRQNVPRLWPTRLLAEAHSQLGDYELLEPIARGGMGIVYKARHKRLNRIVALKLILSGQLARRADIDRFHAEAEAAASLDHPNIVPIYEVGQHDGQHYFAMKLFEGGSLAGAQARSASEGPEGEVRDRRSEVREGQASSRNLKSKIQNLKSPASSARLLSTISRAVHYAHQRGILHRDLKPSNILLDEHGRPYVTDFGLAKRVEGEDSVTRSGAIIGTPLYMAPEQAAGQKRLTTAADIYSLGAILYWLLTGKPVFQAATPLETLRHVQEREPVSPRLLNSLVDRDLETICLKCLEKDPLRRYGSAELLADELDRWLANEPILARPASPLERTYRRCRRNPLVSALAAAVVLVALIGLFGILTQWQAAIANEQQAIANEQKAEAHAAAAREKEKEANQQRDEAQKQRDEVAGLNKELLATKGKLQRMLYASDMNQAKLALDAGAVYRAGELLDKHRPKTGERDFRGFEWYYLDRLCHPDVFTLRGHKAEVYCVAYSPDGKRLASGSDDNTVKVWDAQTGRELLSLTGHTGYIYTVDFSSDGMRLASISARYDEKQEKELPGEVIVWDSETGKQLLTWADAGLGKTVAFSPDGKRIANGSGNEVKLRDSQTGQVLITASALNGQTFAVAFSPDGKRLVCVGGDDPDASGRWPPGEIKILDSQTGHEVLNLNGHTRRVRRVSFSPDGKRLASASLDKTIRVWDAESGQALVNLTGHAGEVYGVAFSPDGTRLASSSGDRSVKLWDAASGRELMAFNGHGAEYVNVVFSPDGKRLATLGDWGAVTILDAEASEARVIQSQHAEGPIAYSPDGKRLATAGGDTAVIWDVESRKEALTLKHPNIRAGDTGGARFYRVAFSPDGKCLATRSWRGLDKDGKDLGPGLEIWDAQTGQIIRDLSAECPRPDCPVSFSPDSQRVATGGGFGDERVDLVVRIWDVKSGSHVLDFKGHKNPLATSALDDRRRVVFTFSPDGRRVASTMPEPAQRLVIWNAETGEEILTIGPPRFFGAQKIMFSPSGDRLACASGNNVRILDARTGAELLLFRAHASWINDLAFSPDAKRLAVGLHGGTVAIWDAEGGEELLSFDARNAALAFSPDGQHLAISSEGAVKVLDGTAAPPQPRTSPSKRFLLDHPVAEGWYRVHDSNIEQLSTYEMGLDTQVRHGGDKSAYIKSVEDFAYGELIQLFRTDDYRGKRVRLTGYIKANEVSNFAAVVMRVDSETTVVGFDPAGKDPARQISGTTDWEKREVVLDVPPDSVSILISIGLVGRGQIWADDFKLEVVGQDVPTTGEPTEGRYLFKEKNTPPAQTKPLNLDFEK
jgi:WD40 repeat protein/serine/threonine protein kinase